MFYKEKIEVEGRQRITLCYDNISVGLIWFGFMVY